MKMMIDNGDDDVKADYYYEYTNKSVTVNVNYTCKEAQLNSTKLPLTSFSL